jgi:hypothetical protein
MVDDEFRGDCKPLQSRISKSTKTYLHHHHHHISPGTKSRQNPKDHGEAAFNSQFTILDSIPILSYPIPTMPILLSLGTSYPSIFPTKSRPRPRPLIHLHPLSIDIRPSFARKHAAKTGPGNSQREQNPQFVRFRNKTEEKRKRKFRKKKSIQERSSEALHITTQ